MLDYKALDKEIDVILKSFTKEDLNLWLKLKLERENLEKDMKDFPLTNIIEEWLDKNGNPEIARQVEVEAKLLAEFEMLEGIPFNMFEEKELHFERFKNRHMKTIIKKSELKSIYDIDCPTWKPIIEKYDGWVIDKTAGSPADLWNGNAVEILKTIQSETIDLIVTDPPYKIITGGDSNGKNSTRPKGILSGNRKLMKFIPKFSEWLPECYRVLKNGTHAYFMINSTNLTEMLVEVEKAGFKIHNILIWKKNNCTPSQFYMKNCEYIIFCRKGKAKYINNIGGSKTVHDFNNIIGNKVHPTEKPVELMSVYVENSSNENDIVLDPFMGAGSTGVACLKLNRKFIGIEIEIDYFDIAKNRLMEIEK